MSDLDTLLYAWLGERDERVADSKFNHFYRRAFADLCRHVKNRFPIGDPQDIAQETLLKFVDRIKDRRQHLHSLQEATSGLQPIESDESHRRQVSGWRSGLFAVHADIVAFRADPVSRGDAWRQIRETINDRIPPLGETGEELVDWAATTYGHRVARAPPSEEISNEGPGDDELGFVATIRRLCLDIGVEALDSLAGRPGLFQFVDHTGSICVALTRVGIPSPGLLFVIAQRRSIDVSCRSRDTVDSVPLENLEGLLMDLGHEADSYGVADLGVGDGSRGISAVESEVDFARFLEHLAEPLRRKDKEIAEARAAGRSTRSLEHQLERLMAGQDRLMKVLHYSCFEGLGQEEVAGKLGLSRDQVRYALEKLETELKRFFEA